MDRIELLDPRLLDEERRAVDEVGRLAQSIRVSLGWHYRLDIPWVLRQIPVRAGGVVLDAGAGVGVTQWLLADRGVNVVSVDRMDRSSLSLRFRLRYRVVGLRPQDLGPPRESILADLRTGAFLVDGFRNAVAVARRRGLRHRSKGIVTIHRSGLERLDALPSESVDHIVSVSSLEHNAPDRMPAVVAELWRVLRPGGVLALTVGASGGEDWFHAPSQGWCFSEATLRRLFGLATDTPSNFDRFEEIMAAVRDNEELRTNLARSYFRSGRNGMPWGRWDPQYLSVGIRRTKTA